MYISIPAQENIIVNYKILNTIKLIFFNKKIVFYFKLHCEMKIKSNRVTF